MLRCLMLNTFVACVVMRMSQCFFFFNDTATTEIYTLSLHDALPISDPLDQAAVGAVGQGLGGHRLAEPAQKRDRKSTRLNSSHLVISYAVFCLKKKKNSPKNVQQPLQRLFQPKCSYHPNHSSHQTLQ